MKHLVIDQCQLSPRVELNPEGIISINGKCILEDTVGFFNPIFRWIKICTFNTVKIEFRIDYANTGSVKQFYNLLELIKENYCIKHVYVNWYFETGDEDHFDLGKTLESQTNIPFDFYEYSNVG